MKVISLDNQHQEAHEQLVMIALRQGDMTKAEHFLNQLVSKYPQEALYGERLASFLAHRGRLDEAAVHYQTVLKNAPGRNKTRFNFARLLKQMGRHRDAIAEYGECIERGIEQPEEVFSNISVAYTEIQQHEEAAEALETALRHNKNYIPALFNLGLLREEQGDWSQAATLFEHILQIHPQHPGALVHLANGNVDAEKAERLRAKMLGSLAQKETSDSDKEELLYALGKLSDEVEDFVLSFEHYSQANALSKKRCEGYNRMQQEQLVSDLIKQCDRQWLDSVQSVSQAPLVFVCGMFRSGTTLLEQMLAMHPQLTSGGEIDFFQKAFQPFPAEVLTTKNERLQSIGQGYLDYLDQCFPGQSTVINKRPDNFLIIGAIKALFPNAKFLCTQREALDNCISLYFQPLGQAQAYANDLMDAGHYYQQQLRLISHWQDVLKDDFRVVRYEALVESPRDVLQGVLAFLDLEWSEDCLRFNETSARVRTASAHQVRKPVYSQSVGRWRNYEEPLKPLREYFEQA